MLKLINDSELEVSLNSPQTSNNHYIFAGIVVLIISGLAFFIFNPYIALASFVICLLILFVWQRFILTPKCIINNGIILVKQNQLIHKSGFTNNQSYTFSNIQSSLTHSNNRVLLTISDDNHQPLSISGFEYQKEAEVVQAILNGQPLKSRKKKIVMKA